MRSKKIRSRGSRTFFRFFVAVLFFVFMAGCAHLGVGSTGIGGKEDLTVMLEKANREYEHGRLDLARRDYEALLDKVPDNALVLLQLGNIDYRVGNMEGARQMYEKSLEAKSKQPEVQFNLAMIELGLAQQHLKTYDTMTDGISPEVSKLMSAINDFATASATLTQKKAGERPRQGAVDKPAGS